MELSTLQSELHAKAEDIRALITENLPSKGDVESDCQRLYLLNRLDTLCYGFNGIESSDLSDDEQDNE